MPDLTSSDLAEHDAAALAPTIEPASEPAPPAFQDPALAAMCSPISDADPCGPDLDFDGDADYLNYFANVDGILPQSFFSSEDGRPFDRTSVDLPEQVDALDPLMRRTRDLRLLVTRARLMVLNRDLNGFVQSLAAIAELLDAYWDAVHPRPEHGDLIARQSALGALELPTVVFALQYMPLFEARRLGAVNYRAWMIANDETKPRNGESKLDAAHIIAARGDVDPAVMLTLRNEIGVLKSSLDRISQAFAMQGSSAGLQALPALVERLTGFIDPRSAERNVEVVEDESEPDDQPSAPSSTRAFAGDSLADAREALAAISDYYAISEPSSPTLPLVRQAHQLVGKSFFEVMNVLVPTQVEKAAFLIGGDQVFELPLGKLPKPTELAVQPLSSTDRTSLGASPDQRRYGVETRAQAMALLLQVERHFRRTEPSSPVPWLCERARSFAERDFMAVLRDVLPKAALRSLGSEK